MCFSWPAVAATLGSVSLAQEAEDPFADAVEMRHGLMLQMATDIGKLGAMAKGEAAYDAAVAAKASANIAAIASVISMDQFPAGSEYQASADSFALPTLWGKPGWLSDQGCRPEHRRSRDAGGSGHGCRRRQGRHGPVGRRLRGLPQGLSPAGRIAPDPRHLTRGKDHPARTGSPPPGPRHVQDDPAGRAAAALSLATPIGAEVRRTTRC